MADSPNILLFGYGVFYSRQITAESVPNCYGARGSNGNPILVRMAVITWPC